MTEAAQIEARIELAINDLKGRCKIAVRRIALLKKKINRLELSLSQRNCTRTEADVEKLNALTARLDGLVDSVISESVKAGQKCEHLKQMCRTRKLDSLKLEDLEASRKEMEQLAKDLLCYTLGHFRSSS